MPTSKVTATAFSSSTTALGAHFTVEVIWEHGTIANFRSHCNGLLVLHNCTWCPLDIKNHMGARHNCQRQKSLQRPSLPPHIPSTRQDKQHTNMVPQDALRMLSPRAAGSRTTTACTTDCCPDIRRTCPAKGGIKVDPVVLCPITSVRFGHLELVLDLHVLPIHDEMEKEKIRRAVR